MTIAALSLGMRQRGLGVRDKLIGDTTIVWKHADADRGGHEYLPGANVKRPFQRGSVPSIRP